MNLEWGEMAGRGGRIEVSIGIFQELSALFCWEGRKGVVDDGDKTWE